MVGQKKNLRFAFAGFRHGHICSLYAKVKKHSGCSLVAACEEDPEAARLATDSWQVELTHASFARMLEQVDFEVLAVGDYYGRRGGLLLAALRAGKHVIVDKPICTDLAELRQIAELSASRGLKVGCMLDLRENGNAVAARHFVERGGIGDLHAVNFGGQHPLLLGRRPGWYFEPGKHGGTLNDIAIHGLDLIEWISGVPIARTVAARTWNAKAKPFPHFNDAAQLMVTLDNGCGVIGDVSYLTPDSIGYKLPFYWRFTFWGSRGVLEFSSPEPGVKLFLEGEAGLSRLEPRPAEVDFLDSFLADIAGKPGSLDTGQVLAIARKTLELQAFADSCNQ